MTQEQYLTLKKHRPTFDHFVNGGSWRPSHETVPELDKIRQDLFGTKTNWWCGSCVREALNQLYSAYDNYEQIGAPVIITAGQIADDGRTPKAANKRKRN